MKSEPCKECELLSRHTKQAAEKLQRLRDAPEMDEHIADAENVLVRAQKKLREHQATHL